MTLQQLDILLSEIGEKKNLKSFIVLGSLSVFALAENAVPEEMTLSNEVDSFPEIYPDFMPDLAAGWGQGSDFERRHGYYFDSISEKLPMLPKGWKDRLIVRKTASGIEIKFADPNDVAISKYVRGEKKDQKWIRAGLGASILSLATIEYRLQDTPFLDQAEHDLVKKRVAEDRRWLEATRVRVEKKN